MRFNYPIRSLNGYRVLSILASSAIPNDSKYPQHIFRNISGYYLISNTVTEDTMVLQFSKKYSSCYMQLEAEEYGIIQMLG